MASFVLIVVAFLGRDLLTSPLWLTLAVIGTYIIGNEEKKVEQPIQLQTA